MAYISGGILVLMWILGHDFSGCYNRLALISVDILSRVYYTDSFGKGHIEGLVDMGELVLITK